MPDFDRTLKTSGGAVPLPMSRRTFLVGAGVTALVSTVLSSEPAAGSTRPSPLNLREGTNFAAQVSPDHKKIAIDTLGVLWVLPASGGEARRLTSDLFDVSQPNWSPDGQTLVFQSYRDGVFNLWTIRPDGGGLRKLTEGPYDHREPRWSPDGRSIAFSSDVSGSYGIYVYDVTSGTIAVVANSAEEEYEPTWSPDGTRLAFVTANTRIDVVTLRSGARSVLVQVTKPEVVHQPTFTPAGDDVVYQLLKSGTSSLMLGTTTLVADEEVFPFQVSWSGNQFYYTAGGGIRRRTVGGAPSRVDFVLAIEVSTPRYRKRRRDFESQQAQVVRGIGSPVLSPDGRRVAYRALNDIYLLTIGGSATPLTGDSYWKSDPSWSPDGTSLAYSTDRGGTLDIWVRNLATGTDRQITDLADRAAVSGTWSPNSREIAFLDQDGAVWTVDVATGDVQRVFTATFEPGRPTWSADGTVIALAAVQPFSARYREGLSKILLINRKSGAARYVDTIKDQSLQTRGDDGPVWSPDGSKMVFALASVLWVMPVRPDGTPSGPPRQITDEVSDAPSWSADSLQILYLNNGRLRMVGAQGGAPRDIANPLRWRNVVGAERTIIHAGRMWDGVGSAVRTDVDIVIEGQRIAAVLPHDKGRTGELVDASSSFVMPGLIDIHHHREMQGYSYGDRQGRLWLSLGITTTRSPGSPAYHMVEERESIQSGARIGPRYFATGEAIDGKRIYYNFMRPTFSDDQLQLEFQRAGELDYDLMKCYVRLPVEWQKRVIDFSHKSNIPVTSHYHYPAMALGGDQTEHIGATSRFGFSRTVTTQGTAYDDVIETFVKSRMARTPTLFGSTTLYREDRSLVDDHRVFELYPPWRRAALQATVDSAASTDQSANRANLAAQVQQCLDIVQGGGVIVTGTVSPIDHAAISLHMNLRAMVRYGFTPQQALTTATSASGEFMGEPIGRIGRGMYADLAVVNGNPLDHIEDAAAIQHVFVAGVGHDVSSLLEPFSAATRYSGFAPQRTTLNRLLAPVASPPSNDGYWWHDPDYLETARHACCAG